MRPELVGFLAAVGVLIPTAAFVVVRVKAWHEPPPAYWHHVSWEIRYLGSFHEEGSSMRLSSTTDYDREAGEFLEEWLRRNNVPRERWYRFTCRIRPQRSDLWLGQA